eukprot:CAMPEP_0204394258 /NCGR_PEP_ID=MMETSP0469-20131031/62748_1 /ASSEMBLY_ACC=CAM_ASM_000384 /TAXON_ID=2969 /ORGANISM="Oxyrrhis marina" /LENGTH=303 /DNA_ID=CAMNT_0051388367 /DNA_START=50 /DNA_END=957 /DNA_ORIENTATION=-
MAYNSVWDIPGMKAGVVTGDVAWAILEFAKAKKFAIPAFNVTSSSTIVAVLEAAKKINSPIMIQFSQGGAQFMAGKALDNTGQAAAILGSVAGAHFVRAIAPAYGVPVILHSDHYSPIIIQFSHGGAQFMAGKALDNTGQAAAILGSVAGAHFVRAIAPAYGVPVILHSDHCAKKLLPWFDGMLEADEAYFKEHGEPLFSSHMLDLSEEPDDENIATCKKYLERMKAINQILEMEIGITGGVEDGVDNSGVSKDKLYSTPEDVFQVHAALSPISEKFTIAAAFGNVHGVYKPGNVKLRPELLV